MQLLNAVFIQGHITADPEIRTLPNGTTLMAFAIEHTRDFLKKGEQAQETSYIDIKVWGRLAERVAPSLARGTEAIVSGHLLQEQWTSADGRRHNRIVVVAERISVFGRSQSEKRPVAMPTYSDAILF